MKRLLFTLVLCSVSLPLLGQTGLGSGNQTVPEVGTEGAGTGSAPAAPSGGAPATLFPPIDTAPLDTRTDDFSTLPQAQETDPALETSPAPSAPATGLGTGTGIGPETPAEEDLPPNPP